MLVIPADKDIMTIELGINIGVTRADWYKLQPATGRKFVEIFRGSVLYSPTWPPGFFGDPPPYEYSLRITDTARESMRLQFYSSANEVSARRGRDGGLYQFPEQRVPKLKALLQAVLSTKEIAGGKYAYIPGEDYLTRWQRLMPLLRSQAATAGSPGSDDEGEVIDDSAAKPSESQSDGNAEQE